jgi:hypothetical protein
MNWKSDFPRSGIQRSRPAIAHRWRQSDVEGQRGTHQKFIGIASLELLHYENSVMMATP